MNKKYRIVSLLIVLSFIVTNLSVGYVMAEDTNTNENEKPIYLALGDSITYGYEPSDDPAEALTGKQLTDECFVNILASEKGYKAINKGVIGNTAVGIMSQVVSGELDEYIKQAQIITITCGGNDLMEVVYTRAADQFNQNKDCVAEWGELTALDVIKILALSGNYSSDLVMSVQMATFVAIIGIDTSSDFSVALEQFIVDLNSLTAAIKTKNPDVKIYFSTQYNPYEHFVGSYQVIGTYLGNCAQILRNKVIENADMGQYTVVDIYSAFLGNTASYCNATENPLFLDFHPSVAGHAAIAACFSEVVPQAEIKVKPMEEDKTPNTGEDMTIYLATASMLTSVVALSFIEKKKKLVA